LDKSFQIINLICNISRNIFNLKDVDGTPVDSGWIIVNNGTDLQNCTIDNEGQAIFRWLNISGYNYTVWYRDVNYNPKNIILASDDILIPNSQINLTVNLTTVNFTVITKDTSQAVSGVILILNNTNTGENIVNLTTGLDGKTIFRWLNSSGISSNYSLNLDFYGEQWQFEISGLTVGMVYEVNFSIKAKATYEIKIDITQGELENYETELVSLNPVEFITIEWGSQLKLRVLFNITKAGSFTHLLGPANADSTSFEIIDETMIIQSGSMSKEEDKIGRYQVLIKTDSLESNKIYFIKLKAQKSGYSLPSDLVISLFAQKNNLILNQSENDDSIQSVYWLDSVNMSVKSYGKISEAFTYEDFIFKNVDQTFKFSISDIKNVWNLSKITFNIYNISWNVNISKINITIEDPYNKSYTFNSSNHSGWDYDLGTWTGITLFLNKESPTNDNSFKFTFGGSFDDTIDIIANSYFIRDSINIQYSKFNITDEISIFTEREGWAIKNITFQIQNCYDTSTWQIVNLSSLNDLNITTNEGFKYNLDQGYPNGTGILTIDDRIIYPLNNRFLFIIENSSKIVFDAIIKVDYIQEFYQNQYIETLNSSIKKNGIINGGFFQVTVLEKDWISEYTTILIDQISNGTDYFLPSEIAMNITIGGNSYTISDTFPGQGIFSLENFDKNTIFTAIIKSNQPINFTLYFLMRSSRTITYEIVGTLTYILRERPDIGGMVQYNSDLGYYLQTIDTSLIDADSYTIRFTISKYHYITAIKDLDLAVLNRLTLINQESELYRSIENVYIRDAINFTFLYTDAFTGTRITNLKTQYYIWEQYSSNGSVIEQGQGNIIATIDNLYILDFDTETRNVGDYLLIVTLDKDNYDYKNAMILLTVLKREMHYSLSDNFKNNQINIVQGKTVPIEIKVTDPTKGGIALINATVLLTIGDSFYEFEELGNGTYRLYFFTDNINTFLTSKTLSGIINITKEDYISQEFNIIIVVEMEEIFPGMPSFYFLIILFASLASIGGIAGYKVYKYATIPTFVKKARGMQKAIKGDKSISESLLYRTKEVFIGEIVRDKWDKLGLSLGDILGIEIKKSKKLAKIKRKTPSKERADDLKPIGFLLMRWDERIGTELLIKQPHDIRISDKTLMQVYSTHEYTGERGLITLTIGSMNVLSYYTGPESGYYIMLLLNLDDDPDAYEGGMVNVAQIILQNVEDDAYLEMIPSLFQRLSVYPILNDEQNLVFLYQDELTRMIINILGEYGVILKSELKVWVQEKYTEGFFDLEAILTEFIKRDLIKEISVKGMPSELIFLIKDIFMFRVPPINLLENPIDKGLPTQFTKIYQTEVQEYFKKYVPSEEDNLRIVEILINPQVYETLRLLRTAIITRQDLEKLKKKGVDDIYGVLKMLWDTQMIKVFKDKDNIEYYALNSDFYIDLIFPKYLLNGIKVAYEQKSKSNKVLREYLGVLENTYFDLKSKKKIE